MSQFFTSGGQIIGVSASVSVCLHTIKILLMTFLILCTTFHDLFTQFSSVAQLCLTLCDPIDCSIPVFLSITNFRSLLELMSIESVMPSSHLILCHPSSCPQSFPALRSFQMSQFFTSGGQIIGVSASASVLPMNIQDWFPLRWTGWISFQSKGLSRVFSNTTVQKRQFFSTQFSL